MSKHITSSIISLEKRGYIEHIDNTPYIMLSKQELLVLLKDQLAIHRTLATRAFTVLKMKDNDIEDTILDLFLKEKALYTRLELSNYLSLGDEKTAKKLIPHLATLKCNQYTIPPTNVSKKKSYPLARDLIARTLSRMDITVFPILLDSSSTIEKDKLSELIDAIGYHCFYHQEIASVEVFDRLYRCYKENEDYPIIRYKLITAFSAFPFSKVKKLLYQIINQFPETIFEKEANRSLSLLPKNEVE